MKIMIVDDSAISRNVIRTALKMYGYENTLEADDGVEAMELFARQKDLIELFILDVNMPRMNGLVLLEEIKKIKKEVPVIMLTTESDRIKMDIAREKGALGWIIKPFESEKLIKVIDMVLQRKRS